VAQQDDAPGVVLLGLIFTFVPLMIAVLASLISRHVQDTINIKQ